MHCNCLIVDDEIELAKATCEYFQMFNTSCEWVATAGECEAFLRENTIDVLLLDINLEQESGFELCKRIRKDYDFPILFISARQSDDDILIALNIGGDDYIKKPYSLSVLLAKVNVILKRQKSSPVELASGKSASKVQLDDATMKVILGSREVLLKAKEYRLFSYLYHNANRIITKEELFQAVWGNSFYTDGTLNVHIRKLREKLEENPNEPAMIKTVWGTGYMLEL